MRRLSSLDPWHLTGNLRHARSLRCPGRLRLRAPGRVHPLHSLNSPWSNYLHHSLRPLNSFCSRHRWRHQHSLHRSS